MPRGEIFMTNSSTGIYLPVYENMITRYGDDVVLTTVTKTTSNIEGEETLTDGATATVRVYISRRNRPWFVDKAGLIEGGDAIMLAKRTQTVARDYKVTWNGNTYRIQSVIDRDQPGGNVAFKTCNLFLI